MNNYDDDDDDKSDRILQIIPSNELRLIPLNIVVEHIYDKIIKQAINCELFYNFNIDKLITYYGINAKLGTVNNKIYIINEIKRLFPGIKIIEIKEKTSCLMYDSYLHASWEEEIDCGDDTKEVKKDLPNNSIIGNTKEVKKDLPNNSIIGKITEERIQKSQEKYKKLYK